MKKKLTFSLFVMPLIAICALCCAFSFAACGDKDDSGNNGGGSETPATYTITIAVDNADYGTVSRTSLTNVAKDTAISVNEAVLTIGDTTITATPTQATTQYTYAFDGFIYTGTAVSGDMTITAKFIRTVNNYTVSISANDSAYGSVSQASVNVPYGTAVAVEGNVITVGETQITATKNADDDQYTYGFTGFTGYTATVSGNMNVIANFTRTTNQFTITFEMGDGAAIDPISVDYGTPASELENIHVIAPENHYFVKWQLKTGENTYVDLPADATLIENITVRAVYDVLSVNSNETEIIPFGSGVFGDENELDKL